MKEKVIISIIVPVYNSELYLRKCIDSILNQKFKDFEVILVNDGSTDGSAEICDLYSVIDNRVISIHTKNQGHGAARDTALKVARGEYIGWVDSDDWIQADMFETMLHYAREFESDIVECSYYIHENGQVNKNRQTEEVVFGEEEFVLHEFFSSRMSPGFWNKLYKRELLKDVYFPVGRIHVDFYVNVVIALNTLKYTRIPEALYHYIVRPGNITKSYSGQKIREAIYLFDYTVLLANRVDSKRTDAVAYLKKDAINRLMLRYFEISTNTNQKYQRAYNRIIKKRIGKQLIPYILFANLPLKTRISLTLVVMNLIKIQNGIRKLIS